MLSVDPYQPITGVISAKPLPDIGIRVVLRGSQGTSSRLLAFRFPCPNVDCGLCNPAIHRPVIHDSVSGHSRNRYRDPKPGRSGRGGMYQVGLWYHAGGCLKPDGTKAVEWFRRAAEQGHADAQYELGLRYYYGYYYSVDAIEQDDEEAAQWIQKAAEQGHSRAAWWLGDLYAYGRGVAKDTDRAEHWYRRAFAGNALSQVAFDRYYRTRRITN